MSHQVHQRLASQIMAFFAEYRLKFQEVTESAKYLFEVADWRGIQSLSAKRLGLYDLMVSDTAKALTYVGVDIYRPEVWGGAKQYYAKLIRQRTDPELAETFYNSVYCYLFKHRHIDSEHIFVRSSREGKELCSGESVYKSYVLSGSGLVQLVGRLMSDLMFNVLWRNKRQDISNLVRYVQQQIEQKQLPYDKAVIDIVSSLFFRNKAAYVVGRIRFAKHSQPFVLSILNDGKGIYFDAALNEENDISTVFGFTRSYFLVDVDVPSELVNFLHTLIPQKYKAELYSSIGFYKQGKAEFFRAFIDHLGNSNDQFEVAPGVKGMVMIVFTLPSFPVVFKVIKDEFSHSKRITRQVVLDKYQLVKNHDRVGRMADTLEFTNFIFPINKFSEELTEELTKVAGSSIEQQGDQLLIKHLWAERYMTPLNIYIDQALENEDQEQLFHAIDEYGKAIKELAASNIFAGDMLFKNFGVTRHGRVVFYDYDEILYLTECNFREIPEPLYPEQELAAEPWYSIGDNDVFPEEFSMLMACDRRVKKIFDQLHGDLLTVQFWERVQVQVKKGELIDVYPYREINRFLCPKQENQVK
ncbi:bifunctional isocitrate dehydrogenase kinase/phosphatase [Neptuniibacter sp. QD34_54]|uniref:bifunctional isocitrate dehydrogenase kinase/phosphatase n=1 Tax=Neptuniibacter sp. QD34_54 TaxID=3398208 RepID=UPI0039F5D930